MRLVETGGIVVGSLVLVAGLGIATIAATLRNFPGVFLGFALFAVGYKGAQIAVGDREETDLQELAGDILSSAQMGSLFMTLVGLGAIAYGFLLLFNSFSRTDLLAAFVASGILFTGFMTAHYGVNRTLV